MAVGMRASAPAVRTRQEAPAGPGVGAPGVRLAEVGGEELDVTPGGRVPAVRDQRGNRPGRQPRRHDKTGGAGLKEVVVHLGMLTKRLDP